MSNGDVQPLRRGRAAASSVLASVTFAHRAINQRDEIACTCRRLVLIKGSSS